MCILQLIDEVARNKQWCEMINKENAVIGKPHKFFLNPSKLAFIARKPTECDPSKYEAEAEANRLTVSLVNCSQLITLH